jgi:hypothetical protein
VSRGGQLKVQEKAQSLLIFAVCASNIHWQWTPNRYIPALLGIGLAEAVERIREQWSLELVDYDHGGNNDESKDNSCQVHASLLSVVSGFCFSGGKPRMPWPGFFARVVPKWRE